jgi:hypothetical protein
MPRSTLQQNKDKQCQRIHEAHKNTQKEEILQVINENFIEIILDVQDTLKKFQDNKNRKFGKAQEQIKETVEALYKQQNETKNTIRRETSELRTKINNIKEEVTHDMENLRKKNKTEMQNNERPLQQTRASRRQTLRTQRQNGN